MNDSIFSENIEEDRMGVEIERDSLETMAHADSLSQTGTAVPFQEGG